MGQNVMGRYSGLRNKVTLRYMFGFFVGMLLGFIVTGVIKIPKLDFSQMQRYIILLILFGIFLVEYIYASCRSKNKPCTSQRRKAVPVGILISSMVSVILQPENGISNVFWIVFSGIWLAIEIFENKK